MENILTYTAEEFLALADENLSRSLNFDCVFHALAEGDPIKAFYTNDTSERRYYPLFFETELKGLSRFSPYLCRFTLSSDDFLQSFARSAPPWGFAAYGAVDFKVAVKHWQSLFKARTSNGSVTHLRYYDSNVMPRLIDSSTSEERALLMGPYAGIIAYHEDGWRRFDNPLLPAPGAEPALADSYKPHDAPWWQMREHHNAAFDDVFKKNFRINLQNFFWESAEPEYIMAREEEHGSIEDFVNEAVNLAEAQGIDGDGPQTSFASLCLEHGLEVVRTLTANDSLSGSELVETIEAKLRMEFI